MFVHHMVVFFLLFLKCTEQESAENCYLHFCPSSKRASSMIPQYRHYQTFMMWSSQSQAVSFDQGLNLKNNHAHVHDWYIGINGTIPISFILYVIDSSTSSLQHIPILIHCFWPMFRPIHVILIGH